MDYHAPLAPLNRVWEYRERRRQTLISVRKYREVAAFTPSDINWSVDRLFDILSVKINWRNLNLWK